MALTGVFLFSLVSALYSCTRISAAEQGGFIQCDESHPCPEGASCLYSKTIIGVKTCFFGFEKVRRHYEMSSGPRRPGRCPISGENPMFLEQQNLLTCYFDEECPTGQRCCDFGRTRTCRKATPLPSTPTITQLLVGDRSANGVGGASATLIQSNGLNVLFDTGHADEKADLLNSLRDKAGLYPEDIHFVLISHGHAAHFSNAGLFPDVVQNINTFNYKGREFTGNPFTTGSAQYYINEDPNLELLQTPGHTQQDTSLLVKNVPGMGAVAVVGDLFIHSLDYFRNQRAILAESADINLLEGHRKRIACVSNYIIPGHGQMFRVDATIKRIFEC